MIFSVDQDQERLRKIQKRSFSDLGILERQDLQEWVVTNPEILGEELLIIQSEYSKFEETRDQLDVLALDVNGKLVVIELKRDNADATTDLQAIKYASYCATLTAEQIQQDYRSFWNSRGQNLNPEDVGEEFADFLSAAFDGEVSLTDKGWASFNLDDKPRILLAAGSFDLQVTAPVMWLIEEHDVNITCVRMNAHEHDGELLLSTRQVIPIQEAEEYMTERRAKQEQQDSSGRRRRAVRVLLDRGVLTSGDDVVINVDRLSTEGQNEEVGEKFWRAEVTGKTGRSDNFKWLYDGEEYSATGLVQTAIEELTGENPGSLNGYNHLCHPEFEGRTLSDLRNSQVEASRRGR